MNGSVEGLDLFMRSLLLRRMLNGSDPVLVGEDKCIYVMLCCTEKS